MVHNVFIVFLSVNLQPNRTLVTDMFQEYTAIGGERRWQMYCLKMRLMRC